MDADRFTTSGSKRDSGRRCAGYGEGGEGTFREQAIRCCIAGKGCDLAPHSYRVLARARQSSIATSFLVERDQYLSNRGGYDAWVGGLDVEK